MMILPRISGGGAKEFGRTITAGQGSIETGLHGYCTAAAAVLVEADGGATAYGSISDANLDGGTIECVINLFQSGSDYVIYVGVSDDLWIDSINIDGTDYTLIFLVSISGIRFFANGYTGSYIIDTSSTYPVELTVGVEPGFNFTAGDITGGGFYGFWTSTLATDLGEGVDTGGINFGSTSADGGTVEGIFATGDVGGAFLYIKGGSASATNIKIDGTDYALSLEDTDAGYDVYAFNLTTAFVGSVAYSVVVT